MKKFLIIIIVILTLSCEIEEVSSTRLIGKWKWKSTCGGIVGCRLATDSTNHFWILEKSTIYYLDNEDTVSTSDYRIKSISGKETSVIYELDVENASTLNVRIENNIMEVDYGTPIVSIYNKVN